MLITFQYVEDHSGNMIQNPLHGVTHDVGLYYMGCKGNCKINNVQTSEILSLRSDTGENTALKSRVWSVEEGWIIVGGWVFVGGLVFVGGWVFVGG